MKAILALFLLFFSALSFACTDFSGEFFDEQDGTYFSISQNGCDSVSYIYDEGTLTIPADGKDYLINKYDIIVEEGKILATVEIYQNLKFVADKLITAARSVTIFTSGSTDIEKGWSETYLDKKLDMISINHNSNGSIEKTINKRVK